MGRFDSSTDRNRMSVVSAGTKVPVTVTYLRADTQPRGVAPPLPGAARIEHAINPPVWFFLALYQAVGGEYEWTDRVRQAQKAPGDLAQFVKHPDVEVWVAYRAGWPNGFFVLDWRAQATCDLAYFGLVRGAIGQGLGGALLKTALHKGWSRTGTHAMTVNTCTLDHPRALALYQSVGFSPVTTKTYTHTLTRDRDPTTFPP